MKHIIKHFLLRISNKEERDKRLRNMNVRVIYTPQKFHNDVIQQLYKRSVCVCVYSANDGVCLFEKNKACPKMNAASKSSICRFKPKYLSFNKTNLSHSYH